LPAALANDGIGFGELPMVGIVPPHLFVASGA
jgi:hypothetical protein